MLLRSDAGQAHRGMVAKVADFGLSVAVDQAQTHVSAMRQVGVHEQNVYVRIRTAMAVSRVGPRTHPASHIAMQGTHTHMAPETLLHSQQGKASDV